MYQTNGSVLNKLTRPCRLRFADKIIVILYIFHLIITCDCETKFNDSSQIYNETKIANNIESNLDSNKCHSCENSNLKGNINTNNVTNEKVNENEEQKTESFMEQVIDSVNTFTKKYIIINQTENQLENEFEKVLDNALSKDRYEILEGIEIRPIDTKKDMMKTDKVDGRALFSTYTYEYRVYQKIKNFFETHILSINLPKAARLMGFRSFGLKKFFLPLIIGMQVFKSILLAMFLPSILGSFGKILGKGISQLSAASSQASYPPANTDDQSAYNDNKDFMGYDTNQAGSYAYPQEGLYEAMAEANDVNDLSNVDMSRFGASGQKVSYLPSKNS
ncbi:hypothetical protein RR48_03284 [Papilio machaon]|uniref:Uncharacterized protein n=1 Tax=Papilio machaon TaxID=76193 RepID=A0A0N1I6D5_PAPMA|nr:hypothetical protein RR48_03284 [Papilio machaon]